MRKFVYLFVMAVVAAAIYLFLGKKPATETPMLASEVAPASSEQSSNAPSEEGAANGEEHGDAEHATDHSAANLGKLSDFTLSNQAGQEFKLAAMKGKVLIVNFFFTRCEGPCPLMNKKMEAFQEKFANDADIKLVSITVDPAHDTVDVIKTYAETFKANPEKWSFLTGSKDVINEVMEKQMKLGGAEDAKTHSTRFVLIDKDANIKGYFDSASEEELTKLESEARQLVSAES